MNKRVKIILILILTVFILSGCREQVIVKPTDTPTPTHVPPTLISTPTSTSTSTPVPTKTLIPTITQTSTPNATDTPTQIPTMTPFPTLDYKVEYPFNTKGLTEEESQERMLMTFVLYIWQERAHYDWWGVPENPDLESFPLVIITEDGIDEVFSLSAFCRFYPFAKLIHTDKVMEVNHYSLDYTFIEAQTLVGVDCATVDISMFPPVSR